MSPHLAINTETLGLLTLLAFILTSLYQTLSRVLRGYFVRRFTTLEDMPLLGVPRESKGEEKKVEGTAVVCGGRYVVLFLPVLIFAICCVFLRERVYDQTLILILTFSHWQRRLISDMWRCHL